MRLQFFKWLALAVIFTAQVSALRLGPAGEQASPSEEEVPSQLIQAEADAEVEAGVGVTGDLEDKKEQEKQEGQLKHSLKKVVDNMFKDFRGSRYKNYTTAYCQGYQTTPQYPQAGANGQVSYQYGGAPGSACPANQPKVIAYHHHHHHYPNGTVVDEVTPGPSAPYPAPCSGGPPAPSGTPCSAPPAPCGQPPAPCPSYPPSCPLQRQPYQPVLTNMRLPPPNSGVGPSAQPCQYGGPQMPWPYGTNNNPYYAPTTYFDPKLQSKSKRSSAKKSKRAGKSNFSQIDATEGVF